MTNLSTNESNYQQINDSLEQWRDEEKAALQLLQTVGQLRFDKGIELVFFRKDLYDARPSQIISFHDLGKKYGNKTLKVEDTVALAKGISDLDFPPSKIDLGKVALKYDNTEKKAIDFLRSHLSEIVNADAQNIQPKDVVLYGFGRIGRLAARQIISKTGRGDQLRLRAIVLRGKMDDPYEEAKKRAALLETDSVHGDFGGRFVVAEDGKSIIVNGNLIHLIYAGKPEEVDYTKYGIENAIVIDNTGVWRDKEGLSRHLRPGVSQVLLTAPGKGVPNIVYGVNQSSIDFEETKVFSAASCTTNAIAPVLRVLQDQLGVKSGHVETIHAYTNDQNLLDNFHKKPRRGRGAPVNMVLTTTGAAKAVTKVMPEFEGKLTGNAVRVPTPNVSLAILNLTLEQKTDVHSLNEILKNAALDGPLFEQIHYSDSTEYVSSNAVGMVTTSVVDAPSTIVSKDGHQATVYLWYDNEFGYTSQVIRLAKAAAKVRRYHNY